MNMPTKFQELPNMHYTIQHSSKSQIYDCIVHIVSALTPKSIVQYIEVHLMAFNSLFFIIYF